MLSVPSQDNPWLENWQVWGLNCDKDTTRSPAQRTTDDADEVKRNLQRVLRNRALDLNAKHRRLSSLRKDLNPFSAADRNETIQMTRSRSFTGEERSPSDLMNRTPMPMKKIPFLQRALQCGLVIQDSPLMANSQQENFFYDSDPEDFVAQRCCERTCHVRNKENFVRRPRTVNLRRDDQVVALVQEMMNEQMTLILHQDTAAHMQQLRPLGVHCWIERGRQLRSGILAPKLHWKSFHPLPTKPSVPKAAPSATNNLVFSSINLMDIARILPATSEAMDRKRFPFCKAKHAFFVKTLDQCLLFEANSSGERDRIVKSLRLVVARLGSLLLTNNERLADEFFAFVDQGHLVPGEAPYWLSYTSNT